MKDKKDISEEMKSFILSEAKLNTVNKNSPQELNNIIKLIAKEISLGKAVTTVIQDKLVSIYLENDKIIIVDR